MLCAPEVDVGGRQVSKVLVVALLVVIFDQGTDLELEISGQEVMLEQDKFLHGLVDLSHICAVPGARLSHSFSVCGAQPIFEEIDRIADQRLSCCP
jgi:hypothetical protein